MLNAPSLGSVVSLSGVYRFRLDSGSVRLHAQGPLAW